MFVQGGGNTALDAAVTAKKLGAERSIICYRRSQLEMPAWEDEFVSAVKDGVEFLFQTQVLGADEKNGKVAGAVLAPVVLGEADASGRRKPVVQEDKRFEMAGSMILTATGKKKNADLLKAFDADKTFVGGDARERRRNGRAGGCRGQEGRRSDRQQALEVRERRQQHGYYRL